MPRDTISSITRLLANSRAERPHLGAFLDRWYVTRKPVFAVPVKTALVAADEDRRHLPSESVLP